MFETGAVIGRARRDRSELLGQLFQLTESAGTLNQILATQMPQFSPSLRLAAYCADFTRLRVPLETQQAPARIAEVLAKELPPEEARTMVDTYTCLGVAFGIAYPDLTETWYRQERGNPSVTTDWKLQLGIDLPPLPADIREYKLESREKEALNLLSSYVTLFAPELREPLQLPRLPAIGRDQ